MDKWIVLINLNSSFTRNGCIKLAYRETIDNDTCVSIVLPRKPLPARRIAYPSNNELDSRMDDYIFWCPAAVRPFVVEKFSIRFGVPYLAIISRCY